MQSGWFRALSEQERRALDELDVFWTKNSTYSAMMAARPQMIGYALTDSPAGLLAFMYHYNAGEPQRALTNEEFLDDVTLYWLTNTAASSARLYWENAGQNLSTSAQKTNEISLPVRHFAAWEQPELLAAELRAAFRSLRQQ